MTITFDLTALYWHMSGIERYAQNMACHIIELHIEHNYVLLFANKIDNVFEKFSPYTNVRMVIIPIKNKFLGYQLKLPLALYRVKSDAYVFNAFTEPFLFYSKNIYSTIHDIGCWDAPDSMKRLQKKGINCFFLVLLKGLQQKLQKIYQSAIKVYKL